MAYKINKLITKYNHDISGTNKKKHIVIHYVGEVSSAENNCKYFANGDRQSGAHYFVDSNSIWQSGYDDYIMWHCGAPYPYNQSIGGASRWNDVNNYNSIGIEGCLKSNGGKLYFDKGTVVRLRYLTMLLMKKYDIRIKDVVRHFDVTGKLCPDCYTYYDMEHLLVPNKNNKYWKYFRRLICGWRKYKALQDMKIRTTPKVKGDVIGHIKKGDNVYIMRYSKSHRWAEILPGQWIHIKSNKRYFKLIHKGK